MKELQRVFMMNDIQNRIDQTKQEIVQIEKQVSKLLSEIQGHGKKKDASEKRRNEHRDKKSKQQAQVDEHLAFFGDKTTLVEGHREHLDVMSMSVAELKSKFTSYKKDLHQAFLNKQYDVCVELSEELGAIKYELDEQTGQHTLMLQAHADETSILETKTVDHAQADVELRHLHDLLVRPRPTTTKSPPATPAPSRSFEIASRDMRCSNNVSRNWKSRAPGVVSATP